MTAELLQELTQYYTDQYLGHQMTAEDAAEIIPRAYDIVNNAICLSGYTVDTVPEFMTEAARNAVCAQAEFIFGHGGLDGLNGGETGGSVSLGKFSYSGNVDSLSADKISSLCGLARSYLQPTGLLRKGVNAV